jgi:hypothetical protein
LNENSRGGNLIAAGKPLPQEIGDVGRKRKLEYWSDGVVE